jgi:hypothetical protein
MISKAKRTFGQQRKDQYKRYLGISRAIRCIFLAKKPKRMPLLSLMLVCRPELSL